MTLFLIILATIFLNSVSVWFICSLAYNKKMFELNKKSTQLKLIIEGSIKDRHIDKEEYDNLREIILDLEELLK